VQRTPNASSDILGQLTDVGLPAEEIERWLAERPNLPQAPAPSDELPGATQSASQFFGQGQALLNRLPTKSARTAAEESAAAALKDTLRQTRVRFLRAFADGVYAALTDDLRRFVRVADLVYAAAERFPGLTPSRAEVAADDERLLKDKEGVEIDQGLFLSAVLARPRAGAHLVHAMLRPKAEAAEHLAELQHTDQLDLGTAVAERRGPVGYVYLRNTRYLNAEDDATNETLEAAIDAVLLDPRVDVGVLRGAPVEHPKYAGRRVFNAGINLTKLYQGKISYLFYITRDMGLVNKLYRGLSGPEFWPEEPEQTLEKPWIAAVDAFAIGGGCQLLLTMDYILAEKSAFFSLPARKEGIIPGAANLRLARWVGARLARHAILFDQRFAADSPEGRLLCDDVAAPDGMDSALERTIAGLTQSGLVSAAGNRKALRIAQEPLSQFQSYMALYAREQAFCHFSPALVRNLEEYWNARR
jgi:thioesterase DpgC